MIPHNLADLSRALSVYKDVTGKSTEDVLRKQGGFLAFAFRRELRGISPIKGSIRASAMDALDQGLGIRVRPSVRRAVYAKHRARQNVSDRRLVFGGGRGRASTLRKGKRVNLQALAVQREIHLRESARGFLSVSANYPGIHHFERGAIRSSRSYSRVKQSLSDLGIQVHQTGPVISFEWLGMSEQGQIAAEGLTKAKGDAALSRALRITTSEIDAYLMRKLDREYRRVR
jgi:hypothetical protein